MYDYIIVLFAVHGCKWLCDTVLRDKQWKLVKWFEVVVGDLVKIVIDQSFPADLVLLSSR